MSPTDVSNITFHQVLDCSKCLLMSDIKSLRSGKLALVPSLAFDKHMSRGLVLEHRDHHALQEWEGRLRRHLRGKKYLFSFHLHYHPVFGITMAAILSFYSRCTNQWCLKFCHLATSAQFYPLRNFGPSLS